MSALLVSDYLNFRWSRQLRQALFARDASLKELAKMMPRIEPTRMTFNRSKRKSNAANDYGAIESNAGGCLITPPQVSQEPDSVIIWAALLTRNVICHGASLFNPVPPPGLRLPLYWDPEDYEFDA